MPTAQGSPPPAVDQRALTIHMASACSRAVQNARDHKQMVRDAMTHGRALALLLPLGLGACAIVPPDGPLVLATPPNGKDLAQFRAEDSNCRNYASTQIGYGATAQAANQAAAGSAVAGTALGAGAGALIGSAAGAAGAGAAIGAGAGLLVGSAMGANNANATTAVLQQRYDAAYAQCMTSAGNTVQTPLMVAQVYGGPYYSSYPYYSNYPYYFNYPYYYGYGPAVTFGFGFSRGYYGYRWGGYRHRWGGHGYRSGWHRR